MSLTLLQRQMEEICQARQVEMEAKQDHRKQKLASTLFVMGLSCTNKQTGRNKGLPPPKAKY